MVGCHHKRFTVLESLIMLRRIGTSVACLLVAGSCLLSSGNVFGGTPVDLAENLAERNAYLNAYSARAIAQPLPVDLSEDGASNEAIELAVEGMLRTEEAFQLCKSALETGDNELWSWACVRSYQAHVALEELHELVGGNSASAAATYAKWAAEDALEAFELSEATTSTATSTTRTAKTSRVKPKPTSKSQTFGW